MNFGDFPQHLPRYHDLRAGGFVAAVPGWQGNDRVGNGNGGNAVVKTDAADVFIFRCRVGQSRQSGEDEEERKAKGIHHGAAGRY